MDKTKPKICFAPLEPVIEFLGWFCIGIIVVGLLRIIAACVLEGATVNGYQFATIVVPAISFGIASYLLVAAVKQRNRHYLLPWIILGVIATGIYLYHILAPVACVVLVYLLYSLYCIIAFHQQLKHELLDKNQSAGTIATP